MTNTQPKSDFNLPTEVVEEFKTNFWQAMEMVKPEYHRRNHQQVIELGRFIHCHLLIESRLHRLIQIELPNISDIDGIARHFDEKLAILQSLK